MKKYLGISIALIAILTMGSASAIVFQTTTLSTEKSQILIAPLGGGCGGGCGGHCHNNTNMTEVTGVLTYDEGTFSIGTLILHFGCSSYLNTTSPYDFDGDGTIETRLNELLGLVGTSITVDGIIRCQNTRMIVFYIDDLPYRDCSSNKYRP